MQIPESLASASPDELVRLRSSIKKYLADIDLARTQENLEEVRERCQTLKGYMGEAWNKLEPGTRFVQSWHIDAITDHLTAVTDGHINRLLINVPPGSSKSLTTSVMWPSWEWGPRGLRHLKYLATSYNDGPVKRDTRKHRNLTLSPWYQALWPDVRLVRRGETSFENSDTGTREGSAFKSLTSKRGDRLIIDDPHSTETAESDIERANAVRIFREGALDRLNDLENSAIVVIMQRLHEQDISGLIIDEMKEQGFVHLMIPMRLEIERRCVTYLPPAPPPGQPDTRPIFWQDPRSQDGELMDPVRFPEDACQKMEAGKGAYGWAGQYQQRPSPREGGMIKADKIEVVDFAPPLIQAVRGWDIAGSTRKTSPYTVGLCMGLGADGYVYITDIRRDRCDTDKAEAMIVNCGKTDNLSILQSIPQDPGQSGKAQVRHLGKALAGGNFKFSLETGSKELRAIPFASMVNCGLVRMVKAPWNEAFRTECKLFPASMYKDQVDAASRAYSELVFPRDFDGIGGAEVIQPEGAPPPPEPRRDRGGRDNFLDTIIV